MISMTSTARVFLYSSAMRKDWKTRLIHPETDIPQGFRSLITPVYRGSTVLFSSVADATDQWDQYKVGYSYGLYGTPTALELAARICELERGFRTFLAPGGQAAIALVNLSLLKAGDLVLFPESIYLPNRRLAMRVLRRFGVEVGFYDPLIGPGIAALLRPNTRLVWCESPGSITMEVQDVPAIVAAAHAANALVALDNTWSAGVYFDALAHNVDVAVQAITKYIGGHSDLLLGSATLPNDSLVESFGDTQHLLGLGVSPDDCSLALRGMKTMAVRLDTIEKNALALARWLADRPEIEAVLHPALPSCPGHELWKRDFTGSSGLFSIVFKPRFTKKQVRQFVDSLQLFEIGYSWGGTTSLAMAYDFHSQSKRPDYGPRIVRLNVGLESLDDLQADVAQSLAKI